MSSWPGPPPLPLSLRTAPTGVKRGTKPDAAAGSESQATAIAQIQQGRSALIDVAGALRGPLHAVDTGQRVIRIVRYSLRWLTLAIPVAMILPHLRRGQRPPLPLILALAFPILWSRHDQRRRNQSSARPPQA